MKIYTKGGDSGETSLFGGERVDKDHDRIAAYGTLDELNAVLGLARAQLELDSNLQSDLPKPLDGLINEVQNRLFDLGAELATPADNTKAITTLSEEHVLRLEQAIDRFEEQLPQLKQFILPGGSVIASQLHLARCVCRRAERKIVTLSRHEPVREVAIRYVNRLSDFLFVAARAVNHATGVGDTPWEKAE